MLLEILGMSETRFFTIYIAQGVIFAFFSFLAYKIIQRDRKRLNIIFASFYISAATGLFINFIYGPLDNINVIYFLNYITNFCLYFSVIFLLVFCLILLKSEKVITKNKQLLIISIYGILISLMILFPWNDPEWGINIAEPQASPDWSIPFYLYVILVISIVATIPIFYFAIKIFKKFEDTQLKRKWKFFIIGTIEITIFTYGILTSNMLNMPAFRTIMGAIGLVLAISGGYLIYYGVGKQIER